jgi:hypothetical protein
MQPPGHFIKIDRYWRLIARDSKKVVTARSAIYRELLQLAASARNSDLTLICHGKKNEPGDRLSWGRCKIGDLLIELNLSCQRPGLFDLA